MKRKLIISIISLCLILSSTIVINASTGEAKLVANKTTIQKGETFTATLSATCVDGINGISTKFNYDDTKLELISATTASSNWSSLGQGTEIVVICNSTSKITSDDIYVLTFKAKGNLKTNSETTINVEEVMLDSDATENSEFTVQVQSVVLKIVAENVDNNPDSNKPGSDNDNNSTNNIDNSGNNDVDNNANQITNTVGNTSNNSVSDNKSNIKGGVLPQTGNNNMVLLILIGIGALAITIFYVRIAYINKEIKK